MLNGRRLRQKEALDKAHLSGSCSNTGLVNMVISTYLLVITFGVISEQRDKITRIKKNIHL